MCVCVCVLYTTEGYAYINIRTLEGILYKPDLWPEDLFPGAAGSAGVERRCVRPLTIKRIDVIPHTTTPGSRGRRRAGSLVVPRSYGGYYRTEGRRRRRRQHLVRPINSQGYYYSPFEDAREIVGPRQCRGLANKGHTPV